MKFLLTLICLLSVLSVSLAEEEEYEIHHSKFLRTLRRGSQGGEKKDKKTKKLEAKCSMLSVFSRVVRTGNSKPYDWSGSCFEFKAVEDKLCPKSDYVGAICAQNHPEYNPAVRFQYCEPLFAELEDGKEKRDCINDCVSFVSQDMGNCCKLDKACKNLD